MNSDFINKYVEITNNELTKIMREKLILQTQYDLSLSRIKDLEKNIEELDATIVKLEKKNTSTTKKEKIKEGEF